ncbi:MAG: hypothetical protein WD851_18095 [Pirellulales bacterium]
MRFVALAILAVVACGGVAGAASPHVDDFASSVMGWGGGSVPQWQSSGGPMGDGYLRVQTSESNLATHVSTEDWVGDYTTINAETISLDMKNDVGSDALLMRLVLFGASTSPASADRWSSSVAATVPADGMWRNYSFSLAQNDLTRVLGSDTYQNMITNVVQIMLRHDPGSPSAGGTPVSATLGIDNVRLAAAPLPGDYNRDGEVDLDDYHTWRGMYGATGSAADGNLDGVVDAADYTVWRDKASIIGMESGASSVVPEASGPLILVAGALGAYCLTRRKSLAENRGADDAR